MYNYVETFIFFLISIVKRQFYLSIVRVCVKFKLRSNILPAFYSNYFLKSHFFASIIDVLIQGFPGDKVVLLLLTYTSIHFVGR